MKDKHLIIRNTTLVKCYDQFETVVVPEGVEKIDSYAFGQCENLKEVILPSTLIHIGTAAFYGCKKLEKVNLPSSIKISKENYTKLPKFLISQFSNRIIITDNSLEDLIEEKKSLKEVNTYLSHIEER